MLSNGLLGPAERAKQIGRDNSLSAKSAEYVLIFKTNGLQLFHSASPAIFLHLSNQQDFKTEAIKKLLERAFSNLSTEYISVSSPAFWKRGSTASGINQAAIRKYATALATAIHAQPGVADEIAM